MASQTFTGKAGWGSASLGATRLVTDIEVRVTAITSTQVRQGDAIGSTRKIGYAGSYGLLFVGGAGELVTRWYPLAWTQVDIDEPSTVGSTHVFWAFRPGVTATLVVAY